MKALMAAVAAAILVLSPLASVPAYAQGKGPAQAQKGKAQTKGKSATKGKAEAKGKSATKGREHAPRKGKGGANN